MRVHPAMMDRRRNVVVVVMVPAVASD